MSDKYPGTTHYEGCWKDAHPAHRPCIERHVAELERQLAEAKKAAQAMVKAMDRCKSAIAGAFGFQAIHGGNYTGPAYGVELEALRALTAPTEDAHD